MKNYRISMPGMKNEDKGQACSGVYGYLNKPCLFTATYEVDMATVVTNCCRKSLALLLAECLS